MPRCHRRAGFSGPPAGFFWIDPNDKDAHRPSVLWRGRQVMKLMPHTPGRTSLSAAIAFAVAAMAALPATSFAQDAAPTAADAQETPATADAATLDAVRVKIGRAHV